MQPVRMTILEQLWKPLLAWIAVFNDVEQRPNAECLLYCSLDALGAPRYNQVSPAYAASNHFQRELRLM